jgi:hypothetical protein
VLLAWAVVAAVEDKCALWGPTRRDVPTFPVPQGKRILLREVN